MERALLIIGTFATVIAAIPAVIFLWERFRPAPKTDEAAVAPERAGRRRWIGLFFGLLSAVFLGATIGGILFFQPPAPPELPVGFNSSWPDAIRCKFRETPFNRDSEIIFYYKGSGPRFSNASVQIYFNVGNQWSDISLLPE